MLRSFWYRQVGGCPVQVHGGLLQVRHLLEAQGCSLQSSEAQTVLPRTAALLLERLWLATPLCRAQAVSAAYLRAAGALLAAARSAEPLSGDGSAGAASALARGVMGVCQEALIGQESAAAAPAHPSATTSLPHHGLRSPAKPQAAPQPASDAGNSLAGSDPSQDGKAGVVMQVDAASHRLPEDRHSSRGAGDLPVVNAASDAAGADGAEAMRSVFLKEAALLYFSPVLQDLAWSEATGEALPQLSQCPRFPEALHAFRSVHSHPCWDSELRCLGPEQACSQMRRYCMCLPSDEWTLTSAGTQRCCVLDLNRRAVKRGR